MTFKHMDRIYIREMGGALRNPAPRNHSSVWMFKPSRLPLHGCIWWNKYRRVPTPLRSTSPFSDVSIHISKNHMHYIIYTCVSHHMYYIHISKHHIVYYY